MIAPNETGAPADTKTSGDAFVRSSRFILM
jgi:hypothetical protein